MEFKKYQHLERLGTNETQGIENGMCYVFPKIDGSNAQIWMGEDGILKAGSRNRELTLDNDHANFCNWVGSQINYYLFFKRYPTLRLYGEWLIPHTLKTYEKQAWNNFYVFDVMNGEEYMPYELYSKVLDEYSINYIPPICKIENPTYERLIGQLEKNTYLVKDGEGVGEGIVIKNYDFRNKYGRVVWAKIVSNEFKAKHSKCQITELKEKNILEEEIAIKYVTKVLIEKELAKIEVEDGWTSKLIPRLLSTVFYCLIKEECWDIIKEYKKPVIDFKRLSYFTNIRIKQLMPHLF